MKYDEVMIIVGSQLPIPTIESPSSSSSQSSARTGRTENDQKNDQKMIRRMSGLDLS